MMTSAALAVFGGTFDPVHFGHIASAVAVSEALGDIRVVMVPCQLPPHRSEPGASPADRVRMLELALAETSNVEVDARELDREGPSYTFDTLRSLRAEIGPQCPLVFVIGSDAYKTLPEWYRWREMLDLCHLLVLERPGDRATLGAELAELEADCARDQLQSLLECPAGNIVHAALVQVDVSATEVRRALGAIGHEKDVTDVSDSALEKVPAPVLDYIKQQNLYGAA